MAPGWERNPADGFFDVFDLRVRVSGDVAAERDEHDLPLVGARLRGEELVYGGRAELALLELGAGEERGFVAAMVMVAADGDLGLDEPFGGGAAERVAIELGVFLGEDPAIEALAEHGEAVGVVDRDEPNAATRRLGAGGFGQKEGEEREGEGYEEGTHPTRHGPFTCST